MTIDIYAANAQARRLQEEAASLLNVKRNLLNIQGSLAQGWQATEMNYLNNAINRMEKEISTIVDALQSLSADISSTASQLKREEEEKEAAKAAALLGKKGS
ncbi:uncharacterized protein YukE [Bacillus tianshenii]|uniref:Uncharacterized protein YukE n=1 Tax=Sutcliffiella tianshenii TaxID=1463404 RepID=A0ABS2NUX0_9BACI|nr:hypothetical protein [Bacillus tianshenii]MBM7618450.1 uncharacterized protein YukE [Bacillus tianshenii]MCA1320425.1 hypothetical protein [Bacillus tianshenii]